MLYRTMGWLHAAAAHGHRAHGQGTVEYVGLMMLIATVLAVVVAFGGRDEGEKIARLIVGKLRSAIDHVQPGGR